MFYVVYLCSVLTLARTFCIMNRHQYFYRRCLYPGIPFNVGASRKAERAGGGSRGTHIDQKSIPPSGQGPHRSPSGKGNAPGEKPVCTPTGNAPVPAVLPEALLDAPHRFGTAAGPPPPAAQGESCCVSLIRPEHDTTETKKPKQQKKNMGRSAATQLHHTNPLLPAKEGGKPHTCVE